MSLKMMLRRGFAAGALALGLAAPESANALDIYPGSYSVLPAGTTLGLLYFGFSDNSNLRVAGAKVPKSKFDLVTYIPRVIHYSEIAGVPIAVQAILPIGKYTESRIGGVTARTSDGLGDLIAGLTVFPLSGADKPGGTTLGVTAYASAPTGDYDAARPFNVGGGTWSFFPQLGIIQNLGNGFVVDLAADVTFFKDHREFGLKYRQDESYQLQAYLRKNLSPTTFVAAGYNGRLGGKKYVGGLETGLKTETNALRVYAGTFVTPTIQLSALGGFDVSQPQGGFRNAFTGQIRVAKVFSPPVSPVLTTKP